MTRQYGISRQIGDVHPGPRGLALFEIPLRNRIGAAARIDTIAPHPIQFLNHTCRGSSVVERRPEKAGVASSILAPGTSFVFFFTQII
jgi:hypothetical protein